MATKRSSRGSAAASEIRVYIQDDNHDKEIIEGQDNIEKISSEESVNSQELEETPQKSSVSLNIHRVRWQCGEMKSNALILRLIDEYVTRPCFWNIFSCHCRRTIVNYREILWPFDQALKTIIVFRN